MDGSPTQGWEDGLERWPGLFLGRLRREAQRHRVLFYLKGLLLPGERESVEPVAARVGPADTQRPRHFVSTSPWATAPLEDQLVRAADRLVDGPGAVLVVDDTALVKQGRHPVGVRRRYCGQPGKKADCCQAMVSLTLARAEAPVCVGLRLFLPERWADEKERLARAGVPETITHRPMRGSRWARSTAPWPPAPASAACWPTRSTAGRPGSAPASASGGSPTRRASRRRRRSTPRA